MSERWTANHSGYHWPHVRNFYTLADGMIHSRGWLYTAGMRWWAWLDPLRRAFP